MKSDYLKELGYLGFTARLKRLSDAFSGNIKELYKAKGLDIEPSWHLVFLILKQEERCTMTELADAFHMSQPAVTKMIARMIKKGYITAAADNNDRRKKVLRLTRKAKNKLPQFERIWKAGRDSVREMLSSNDDFLEHLKKLETEIEQKSFAERAMERL